MVEDALWLNTFQKEYELFDNCLAPFNVDYMWLDEDVEKNCHEWFCRQIVPRTKVLGLVGCRATSKPIGTGCPEREWKVYKILKSGQRCSLSSDTTMKQATCCSAYSMEKADMQSKLDEKLKIAFDDDDFQFIGCDEFCVQQHVPQTVLEKNKFFAFIEGWEVDVIHNKLKQNEETLKRKFGGIEYFDFESGRLTVYTINNVAANVA